MYSIIRDWCGELGENTIALDVCCGTGTIGLTLAKRVKTVIGVEMVTQAVEDARYNATANGVEYYFKILTYIRNAEFVAGKAEDVLNKTLETYMTDENTKVIAIVDPPRSGLHNKVIKAIRACKLIDRLIYVSCKQTSFVNDIGQYTSTIILTTASVAQNQTAW